MGFAHKKKKERKKFGALVSYLWGGIFLFWGFGGVGFGLFFFK